MVNATFDTAAIAAIQALIGKTFNGYTYSPVAAGAYGNVLLHIDRTAYELRCNQTPLTVGNEAEDIACLSINMHTGDFEPMAGEVIAAESVEQIIKEICIVRDTVTRADGVQLSMDMAIIIKTQIAEYMFSRDVWFSEFITISNNADLDSVYPICKAKSGWKSDESEDVIIKRTTIRL